MINLPTLELLPRKLLIFLTLVLLAIIFTIGLYNFNHHYLIPLPGGKTTVFNRTSTAYEQPSAGLSPAGLEQHLQGDIAFEAVFVTPPAQINPGLGPLFNNASCAGCHIRNGRGMPTKGQLLVRVSQPSDSAMTINTSSVHQEAVAPDENTPPVSLLGTQIQDQAVYGQKPEATVDLIWQLKTGTYGDGTVYELRSPKVQITLANNDPLPANVMTSLRLPPPVFGLGLLEAIPEKTILELADPEDNNKDGISGRVNQVWNVETKSVALGRFGLKANQPNLLQQTAAAYINDMGVTNPLFPERDQTPEINQKTLDDATFYVQTLAVPGRTLVDDSQVQKGQKLFAGANCIGCHIPKLHTGNYPIQPLANQTIEPYTDLLLHDMGDGLADNRPDFMANGKEWRTSPLWGIGLTQTVLPYSSYLHDGRARNLEEAILWHGGEAQASKEAFRNMPKSDRQAMVRFLNSL